MIVMCAQDIRPVSTNMSTLSACVCTLYKRVKLIDTRKQMQETEEQTSNRTCVTVEDETTVSSEDRTEER